MNGCENMARVMSIKTHGGVKGTLSVKQYKTETEYLTKELINKDNQGFDISETVRLKKNTPTVIELECSNGEPLKVLIELR